MIWIGEPFCLRTCIDRGCPKLCKIDISQRIIYSWIFIEDFNSVRFNRNFQRGNSLPEARTICCAKAGLGCWPSQLCILVIFIPILINLVIITCALMQSLFFVFFLFIDYPLFFCWGLVNHMLPGWVGISAALSQGGHGFILCPLSGPKKNQCFGLPWALAVW